MPAPDADDARDVTAIAYAEATVGDFRLKSSSQYQVHIVKRTLLYSHIIVVAVHTQQSNK